MTAPRDPFGTGGSVEPRGPSAERRSREVEEEIESHLALRTEQLIAAGWSPAAARAEAVRRFGDLEEARRSLAARARRRDGRIRLREWLGTLRQDVVLALRQARRAPGFTVMWLATIGVGVGFATAVFAAVDQILLRPLPFPNPERLVALESVDSTGRRIELVSADNWDDWRRESRVLAASAIYRTERAAIGVPNGEAFRVEAAVVPPEFFDVVRPRLVRGRPLGAAPERGVVISEGLWRRLGAVAIESWAVTVNGFRREVVGVIAQGNGFPVGTEIWLPYHHRQIGGGARNSINWYGIGRLGAGATIAAAEDDLGAVARRIRERDPVALYSYGVAITSLHRFLVADRAASLRMLLGAVLLVVLVGSANLSSATLARGTARLREMAIRVAIGAGARRLVRQVLVEHGLLALAGGALGVVLAAALVRLASGLAGELLSASEPIVIDRRIQGFALGVSLVAALVSGILPALQAARAAPAATLGNSRADGVRSGRSARLLVCFEIAAAVTLVVSSGLLIRSLQAALSRPLGFATAGVVAGQITLAGPSYQDRGAVYGYWDRLLETVRGAPAVEAAGLATWAPLGSGAATFIEIAGRELPGAGSDFRVIGEGYLEALQVPLLAGRLFTVADDSTRPPVALVNRRLAEKYWPGGDPLGQLIRAPSMEVGPSIAGREWMTIVGVVGDIRHWGHETELQPELFVSYRQYPMFARGLTLVARGAQPASRLATTIRERAAGLDPTIPSDVEPLANRADRRLAPRRFTMTVTTVFGLVALGLATLGVFGVLSFAVVQRTRELAVRSALGATQAAVVRLVLAGAGRLIAAGVVLGVGGAWAAASTLRAVLFEVEPLDPGVMLGTVVVIVGAGTVAAVVPARRATRVDPMTALRAD